MPTEINSMSEWNTALSYCGCCPMPECPEPQLQGQIESKSFSACGYTRNGAWDRAVHPFGASYGGATPALPCGIGSKLWRHFSFHESWLYHSVTESDSPSQGPSTTTEDGTWNYSCEDTLNFSGPANTRVCVLTPTVQLITSRSWSQTSITSYEDPPHNDGNGHPINRITATSSTGSGSTPGGSCGGYFTATWETGPSTGYATGCWNNHAFVTEAWSLSGSDGSIHATITIPTSTSTTTRTSTLTMSDPWTVDDLCTELDLRFTATTVWSSGTWGASRSFTYPVCSGARVLEAPQGASESRFRYRWRIPNWHKGNKFRIEWDEVFFPYGWDVEGYMGDPPTLTPKSYEWSGPGHATNPDDDSWFSPWSAVVKVPAGKEGTVAIRNTRYTCYGATPYGNPKPQYRGDIFTP